MLSDRPAIIEDEHLEFLDDLRERGVTNMFGASPYIMAQFGVGKMAARSILVYWIDTFGERHREEKEDEEGRTI